MGVTVWKTLRHAATPPHALAGLVGRAFPFLLAKLAPALSA